MTNINKKPSIVVMGGAGHIGLPLSLCIAKEGLPVSIYDLNKEDLKKNMESMDKKKFKKKKLFFF